MATRKNTYLIDANNTMGLEGLIDAVNARGSPYEMPIRTAAHLQNLPFAVFIDYLRRPADPSPVQDLFTFDMDTDELILFSDEARVALDALLEMAMFMRGFTTLMGLADEWKVQVAIGAWRRVRESLKRAHDLPYWDGQMWSVNLTSEGVAHFDEDSFSMAVTLAGCIEVDVDFPVGTSPKLIEAYRQMGRVYDAISDSLGLADSVTFNRRLHVALTLIEQHIAPRPDGADGDPLDKDYRFTL